MAYYQARDAVPKDTVGPDYFEARHEEYDEPVEICDKKRFDGDEVEYLVRCKDDERTREFFGTYDDCDDLIREYEQAISQ